MKKNLRRLVSVVLLVAVLMGLAVPALADGEVMMLSNDEIPSIVIQSLDEDILALGRERILGLERDVFFVKPGCSIEVLPNVNFDGKVTQIYLHAGTSDQIYYFESGWENISFEQATISFTSGVTKDGKVVDLSDPAEVYYLAVIGDSGDGSYFSHLIGFRPASQVGDSFVPLTIKDGVLTAYQVEYEKAGHVTLPDSVTAIGSNVFQFRDDITGVTIPNSVTSIQSGAFSNCTGLTEIVIPDSVTTIGSGAFSGCAGLKEVVIPDSVTELGGSAFSMCTALERVVIGNGVTKLEDGAFADCPNLKSVVMGQNVACIGDSAFAWCTGLTSLTLPQSVAYIGAQAFRNCSSLREITIPETTVISSMRYVFEGCDLLNFTPQHKWWENAASGKIVGCPFYETDTEYVFDLLFLHEDGTLSSIAIQVGINEWEYRKDQTPQNLFGGDLGEYGCKSFAQLLKEASTELVLPEGVKTIALLSGASDYNSIERLVLPNSLQVIGDGSGYAFYHCTNLKEIVFPSPENASPVLKYQDIVSELANCTSLERIVNFPDKTLYERIAANQRIEAAWKGIDPKTILEPQSKRITDLSNQICAGRATDHEKAKAVFDWMTANISYDYANKGTGKAASDPEDVLDCKLAVCDGYARLTQALLLAQNIPAVYISGLANNGSGTWESHAWNMAYVDGRWIYIDSTWGRPGNDGYNPYWFDVSLVGLSMNHVAGSSHAPNYDMTPSPADTATAAPNRSTVLVNGEQVAFDAYTINGNNYFKLRDLAKVLSGTGKQFEVTWDGNAKAINMLSGKPYTTVGGELAQGDGANKTAAINTAIIYLDGQPIYLTAYTINQNNYFKLRDVGQTFDFDVTWDGARNTIVIDTTQGYTAD